MSAAEADILRRARARIEDPARWTQSGFYALDARGMVTRSVSPMAVCWCSAGAIYATVGHANRFLLGGVFRPLEAAATALNGQDPVRLNDHTDHATVMAMFDRAIELAEADQ